MRKETNDMHHEMTRRDLLRMGATAASAAGIAGMANNEHRLDAATMERSNNEATSWKPGDPIEYVNPKPPEFELLPYRGERYQATVPDTLDVAERARLAVNVLTEATDPLADYEYYCGISLLTSPPHMGLNCWYQPYTENQGGALIRTRIMSGSDQNLNVERRWMEVGLKLQGSDGLLYTPLNGRPWGLDGFQIRSLAEPRGGQMLQPYLCGCMLRTMSAYVKRDAGGPWKSAMQRLIDGLRNLAVVNEEYAYFWPSCMIATKEQASSRRMPTHPFEIESSNVTMGLVDAHHASGYEPALALAKKHINYLRRNFYASDGALLSQPGLTLNAHTGSHLRGVLAMEKYAEEAGDKDVMEFVVRAFERAKFVGVNFKEGVSDYDIVETPGAGLVGFFPEWTNSPVWQTCETDQVADMINIALRLSEAGAGDYWDDADRWIRNQFAENQLTEVDWIEKFSKEGKPVKPSIRVRTDNIPQKAIGGFAASPSANDWVGRPMQANIAGCCTVYGANGLFWIWEHILRHDNGRLRINLLLNRASPWADVDSYVPYQGRVDVRIKKPVDLSIRIPEWVKPNESRCQVNGQDRLISWEGRYAKIGQVSPGSVAALTFPIFERTDKVWIEKQAYTLVRKGNDVVSIDPPGVYYPYYQRQRYRTSEPQMRKVTRFVSNEDIAVRV
jgi:hypothetical protein